MSFVVNDCFDSAITTSANRRSARVLRVAYVSSRPMVPSIHALLWGFGAKARLSTNETLTLFLLFLIWSSSCCALSRMSPLVGVDSHGLPPVIRVLAIWLHEKGQLDKSNKGVGIAAALC